jgi:hypothetical protein
MWRLWLGFNMSHGLGIAAFALVGLLLALRDYRLVVDTPGLLPLSILVGAIYFVISLRFWFYGSTVITAVSTTCFILAYLLA